MTTASSRVIVRNLNTPMDNADNQNLLKTYFHILHTSLTLWHRRSVGREKYTLFDISLRVYSKLTLYSRGFSKTALWLQFSLFITFSKEASLFEKSKYFESMHKAVSAYLHTDRHVRAYIRTRLPLAREEKKMIKKERTKEPIHRTFFLGDRRKLFNFLFLLKQSKTPRK